MSRLLCPDYRGPDYRGPDYRGPDYRGPDYRGPDYRGPDYRGPDYRGPDYRGPDYRGLGVTVKSSIQSFPVAPFRPIRKIISRPLGGTGIVFVMVVQP